MKAKWIGTSRSVNIPAGTFSLRHLCRAGGPRRITGCIQRQESHVPVQQERGNRLHRRAARTGSGRYNLHARRRKTGTDPKRVKFEKPAPPLSGVIMLGTLDSWLSDFHLACRALAKSKTFTLVSIVTLALGIGMNTAFFGGIHSFLWAPFPYPRSEDLVMLSQTNPGRGLKYGISYLDAEDWRAARSLESRALYRQQVVALNGAGEPADVSAILASSSLFHVLQAETALGRTFGAGEEGRGEHRVAVISDGLWRRNMGADQNVLGRRIRLDNREYTIIGVLPPGFAFLYEDSDLFVP